jgi:Ser/Thr protein kinase RdoA (MazF antagonist)
MNRFGPALAGLQWQSVPPGFSGAQVWRGDDRERPVFALKAWPPEYSAERLITIHRWISQSYRLPFVPSVLPDLAGVTVVVDSGRVWDVTRWMPGAPVETAGKAEVHAACAALAELHALWRGNSPPEPCRGVRNRLQLLRDWLAASSMPRSSARLAPVLGSLAVRTNEAVSRATPDAIRMLEPWEHVALAVQPCVRDLRGEHVLFTQARVSGIIDYGAMALDNPAVDLARWLGDVAAGDASHFTSGLQAYLKAGGRLDVPDEVVGQLARSGALCSAIVWLQRLRESNWSLSEQNRVKKRLGQLLASIEQFAPT